MTDKKIDASVVNYFKVYSGNKGLNEKFCDNHVTGEKEVTR